MNPSQEFLLAWLLLLANNFKISFICEKFHRKEALAFNLPSPGSAYELSLMERFTSEHIIMDLFSLFRPLYKDEVS